MITDMSKRGKNVLVLQTVFAFGMPIFLFLFCLSLCDGTGWLFCSCHDVVMLLYRIRYKQLQLVSNCARARALRSFVLVNVV